MEARLVTESVAAQIKNAIIEIVNNSPKGDEIISFVKEVMLQVSKAFLGELSQFLLDCLNKLMVFLEETLDKQIARFR